MHSRLWTLGLILGVRLRLGFKTGVTKLFETQSCFFVQIHAKGYQFDTQTSEIKICIIFFHMMLSVIINIKIFIIIKKLIMFMLLSKQAMGNPHGPYRRPGSRGHHAGDPWFRFSTLPASVVQRRALLYVLVSCYRRRAIKFSKVKAPWQTYSHCLKTAWLVLLSKGNVLKTCCYFAFEITL